MRPLVLLVSLLLPVVLSQWMPPDFPPRRFEYHGGHDSHSVEEETEIIHKKKIKNRHHEHHGVEEEGDDFGPPHPPLPPPHHGLPPPHLGLQHLMFNLKAGVDRLLAPLLFGKK